MSEQPKTTGAGRGVLYIAFAKFYFLFVGMGVQFTLPRFLSAEQFGRYSLINGIASWFNNVAVTGTIQSVSRFATQDPSQARAVQHAALRMHLRLGLPVAILFAASAPLVAWFYDDPAKTVPLALAAAIVGGYSFYAVFVGTANGTHAFHKQAGLDITFATLRAIGLLGMAAAGLGVAGVVGGWVGAVAIITCVAVVWVGRPGKVEKLPVKPMLQYFGGVAIYLLLFNALMFADNFVLERVLSAKFGAKAADTANGYYAAAQQLARVSYQAIIAATFVVFPLVSRSTFTEDKDTTRRYIEVTNRYSLAFATAIAVVLASNPEGAMGLLYKPEYAEAGGPALVPLALGYVAFAMFAIAGTILNGAGRSRAAITSAAITLALAAVGNYVAITMFADSEHVLEIAATVTASAMLVGAAITGLQLNKLFGASLPAGSLVRIVLAAGVAFAAGHFAPLHGKGKLMTLVLAAAVAVVFLVVLIGSRELGKRDLDAIKAVRRKRGPE